MIIDPATLNIIKTLDATETSAYLQDALFLTPSMRGTNSTYDDKGNLWFGWMRSVGEEVMLGMGPFGSDTVVPSQWLPGSTNHEDYGSSVVLLLEDLAGMACDVVNRDLTDDEWASLAVDSDRPEVCPGKTEPISSSAPLLERDVEDDRDDG